MASSAPLSKANTTFCLDLFRKLSDNDNTANVFFSPFSISSALAMVMLGARGNTATQMSEVHDTHTHTHTHTVACLVDISTRQMLLYALSVANRLYGEQSYQFIEVKLYNAELESVDFKTSSEAARVNINSWVEKQTQGKIKDVLVQGVVNDMTRLVLVNAIYFKGNWNKQFKENATHDVQFRLNKVTQRLSVCLLLCKLINYPVYIYSNLAVIQILEMPYKGKELSMLIFLPNEIEDGTTGLEKLTYENFVEWTRPDMMDQTEVQVGLPRFKMEEKYDMKTVLVSMGMVDAFDAALSDFSGMSPANDLFLSKVVHKAFVEVNEEGTEAAAATAAIMMLRCAPMPPAMFIADHPFLFFIRHNPSMSVLFAGRYCSPV
uniref:Serpin B6 n=1 Tax=Lates calcarifer TaxID=8187 RepID=A0A4W6G191_LATCA